MIWSNVSRATLYAANNNKTAAVVKVFTIMEILVVWCFVISDAFIGQLVDAFF